MDAKYSDFEKQLLLTFAHANYSQWLRENPKADSSSRIDKFSDCLADSLLFISHFRGLEPHSIGL